MRLCVCVYGTYSHNVHIVYIPYCLLSFGWNSVFTIEISELETEISLEKKYLTFKNWYCWCIRNPERVRECDRRKEKCLFDSSFNFNFDSPTALFNTYYPLNYSTICIKLKYQTTHHLLDELRSLIFLNKSVFVSAEYTIYNRWKICYFFLNALILSRWIVASLFVTLSSL